MGIFSDVKDNMERRKNAREYIQIAKQLVKEGNELYQRAYNNVIEQAGKTQSRLREHICYKEKIAEELKVNFKLLVENFNIPDANIDTESILHNENILDTLSAENNVMSVFSEFRSVIIENPVPLPGILDLFISDEDYYEARNQKDEAKRYKQQMKYEREKLYEYRDRMNFLCDIINLEKRELDSLLKKLNYMASELKAAQNKNSFSQDEIAYLEGIKNISNIVIKLLSENFINDNMEINQQYRNFLQEVEEINSSLPSMPAINDKSVIKELLKINTI